MDTPPSPPQPIRGVSPSSPRALLENEQETRPSQLQGARHSHSNSSASDDFDGSHHAPVDQLHVPFPNPNRPESPASRKRTEEDTLSHQDDNSSHHHHHPHQEGSTSTPHPPSKKPKKSPPLIPASDTSSTGEHSTLSQAPPLSEHFLPPNASTTSLGLASSSTSQDSGESASVSSTSAKRVPPPGNFGSQAKAMRMEGVRPTSPHFQSRNSGEARSLQGNLSNLGEGTTTTGKENSRININRPSSRQTSPMPDFEPTSHRTLASLHTDSAAENLYHNHNIEDDDDNEDDDDDYDEHDEDDTNNGTGLFGAGTSMLPSDSDDSYDSDSLGEIDVEHIAMHDSEIGQGDKPYEDPDVKCEDRLSEDEEVVILDEARVHGVGFVIRKYIFARIHSAKKMLLMTMAAPIDLPKNWTESDLIRTFSGQLKRMLRRRKRLNHVHTLEAVIELLKSSKKIMILTGAGVSVSCGIPDFRSPNGIYSRLSEFELDEPQQMFDLDFFRERPEIFYSFAREIFPSNFTPSPSHYFIKLVEDKGKLLRNYTQNIDTLEQKAGIRNVLQCHGSFATASCIRCGHQVLGDEIKEFIFKQEVAYCKVCKTPSPPPKSNKNKKSKKNYSSSDEDDMDGDSDRLKGLMKPDIVFFGEKLPNAFDTCLKMDRGQVDLLIVMGSSLKVAPVSDIMHSLPNAVPQILINRTPITHMDFDVQLLGDCDTIVAELCRMVGWELRHEKLPGGTSNVPDMDIYTNLDGSGRGGRAHWSLIEPNTYIFEGAVLEGIGYESAAGYSQNPGEGHDVSQDITSHDDSEGDDVKTIEEEGEDDGDDEEEHEPLGVSKKRGRNNDAEGNEVGEGTVESPGDDGSPRRRHFKIDRLESVEPMNEDTPEIDSASNKAGGRRRGTESDARPSTSTAANGSVLATSEPGWQHHEQRQPSSGLQSPSYQQPLPSPSHVGSTEPRSGSIAEIHQSASVPASASTLAARSQSSPEPRPGTSTPTSRRGPLDTPQSGHETTKLMSPYNEKMPKDLGEEDDIATTTSVGHPHPQPPILGPHSLGLPDLHRRLSTELVAISEDARLEQEEDDDVEDAANNLMGGHEKILPRPRDGHGNREEDDEEI
ncbi:NAD-dependent histone deacetylase sir2 [Podila epigama]|nr:NAD-dependent histone deacetylase sir2 [Podila epigama]